MDDTDTGKKSENNNCLLINIQKYRLITLTVLKKKLLLRHNFQFKTKW